MMATASPGASAKETPVRIGRDPRGVGYSLLTFSTLSTLPYSSALGIICKLLRPRASSRGHGELRSSMGHIWPMPR